MALRIALVQGTELIPFRILGRDDAAHPLGDELILGFEVAIERHLVRPRRLGDRFDADTADPLLPKQHIRRFENPLSQREYRLEDRLLRRHVITSSSISLKTSAVILRERSDRRICFWR